MGQHTFEKVEVSGDANAVLGDILATFNLFIGGLTPSEDARQLMLHVSPDFLLLRAAENGDLEQVHQLLTQGASVEYVEKDGQTALHKAVIGRHVEVIHELLSCPNRQRFLLNHHDTEWADTALHRAVAEGNVPVLQALLQYNPSLETKQKDKATPLILAVLFGHANVVKILLERGANPLATNHSGSTPLHIAAHHGHLSVLDVLLNADKAKGWLEMRNDFDDTPIFIAAINGEEACARRLWQEGANLHTMNYHSSNLLHASVHGRIHDFLLDILPHFSTAELNHKNIFCQTPYQSAMFNGRPLCAKVLQRSLRGELMR